MGYEMKLFPFPEDIESKAVLKQLSISHRALATLNGKLATIPNEVILINTLTLQEAKESSAIENIITTHDELYKATLSESFIKNAAAKEVSRYADALRNGFSEIRQRGVITHATILAIQKTLEQNDAGYRRQPGTALVNDRTGETVYTPPQDYDTISGLMDNLVRFINDDGLSDYDPLVKMALIHHQFESIHPFYDGNGRTGRILNILYLVKQQLLDLPVLYLSRYTIQHKDEYYTLLQHVRDTGEWEQWLLHTLKGIEVTAWQTVDLIDGIRGLMYDYKNRIRENHKFYSQDLLNNLFKHPYTKVEFLMEELGVSRQTAVGYLKTLTATGYLNEVKVGRSNFYINTPLFRLLMGDVGRGSMSEPIVTKQI